MKLVGSVVVSACAILLGGQATAPAVPDDEELPLMGEPAPAPEAGAGPLGEVRAPEPPEPRVGLAQQLDPPGAELELVTRTFRLGADEVVQVDLELEAGQPLSAWFEAGAELEWDLYRSQDSGQGDRLVALQRGLGSHGHVELRADRPGRYSLEWSNRTRAPVDMTVSLHLPRPAARAEWAQLER